MSPRAGAVITIVILFAASGVFALAETAFVKASRIKLRGLAESGDKRAARVIPLYDHQERTLNSVLLLLLGCQMVSATLLGSVLEPTFGTVGLLIGSLLEITVFFTFAEVAPKTYAVTHPNARCCACRGCSCS
jgi:putative hemolysin